MNSKAASMSTIPSLTEDELPNYEEELDSEFPQESLEDPSESLEQIEPAEEANPIQDTEEMDEDVEAALKSIIDRCTTSEQTFRYGQLQVCKKHQLFWRGYQFIYWSDVARDYQGPHLYGSSTELDPELQQDIDNFTKVINMSKAHGESVIGALSTATPAVRYFPEDPDSSDDIITASTRTRVSELIQDQNNAPMLFVKALYILWNYGYIGAYNRYHTSAKYGVVTVPQTEMQDKVISTPSCPVCNMPVSQDSDNGFMLPPDTQNDYESIQDDTSEDISQLAGIQSCPSCGANVIPEEVQTTEQVPVTTGEKVLEKGREIIEFYGPLNITIPSTARKQEDVGFLFLDDEYHYGQIRAIYPEFWEKIQPGGGWDSFDRWARHLTGIESLIDQVTVRQAWLRPFQFWTIDDEEIRNQLFKLFPSGVRVVLCNGELLEAVEENLDEHWTLTINPTEESIATTDPLCKSLIPIQEVTNEAFNIILQQMQYGISDSFADSEIIDFDQYKKTANQVGMLYPIRNTGGKPLSDYFHQMKPATMSKEIDAFLQKLEQMGQFVTGSFPSIYGGPSGSGSSKTLGEYEQSRNMALQRLSLPWKMINEWWALVMTKAVASFEDNMISDEKFTKKNGSSYTTAWIRRSEMAGKTGRVVAETSEQFPLSWAQKGAMIFKILGLNSPELSQVLLSPENIDFVSKTFGLADLEMPGEADRLKQMTEISQLLRGEMVMPDEILDNHGLEATVCRNWLISIEGQDAKLSNPQGYQSVYQHFTMHQQIMQAQMMAQQAQLQAQEEQQADQTQEKPPQQ